MAHIPYYVRRRTTVMEDDTQQLLVQHITLHRRTLEKLGGVWTFNYLNGVKIPIQIAARAKRMGSSRGLPDFVLWLRTHDHAGLAIELKRPQAQITKKRTADWKDAHVAEQAATLERLRRQGWQAEFAIGFDEARRLFDAHLSRALRFAEEGRAPTDVEK